MKHLPLLHGLFAIIDDEDFERAIKFSWYVGTKGYVQSGIRKSDGSWTNQYLSRFIMNPTKGVVVDHVNGNKLDNRKSELRFCTQQQNCCNRHKGKNNKSGFKGVSWHDRAAKWMAKITVKRKQIYLGLFSDIFAAASAYSNASTKFHGNFGKK